MSKLKDLILERGTESSVYVMSLIFDSILPENNYEELDKDLSEIDPADIDTTFLCCLLRATFSHRSALNSWGSLRDRVLKTLKVRKLEGMKAEVLLSGLLKD